VGRRHRHHRYGSIDFGIRAIGEVIGGASGVSSTSPKTIAHNVQPWCDALSDVTPCGISDHLYERQPTASLDAPI
jgi:hypothetical protein